LDLTLLVTLYSTLVLLLYLWADLEEGTVLEEEIRKLGEEVTRMT